MPELPEVETIVRELKKGITGRRIKDVWTDFKKMINPAPGQAGYGARRPKDFEKFKREIKERKIQQIWRRGKNILFELSGEKTLLIHQKLTGHLLLGKWQRKGKEWQAFKKGPLADDPMNRFLHLIFWLDNGQMLALSDLRKFAKVELWDSKKLRQSKEIANLGPEPLDKRFTFKKFKEVIQMARGKIKQVLMNQQVLVGIGNIYSDEILFAAKIHPFKDVSKLTITELKKIYQLMQSILKKAIELKGESISDFRRISGEKGEFDPFRKVYRRKGEKCQRCGTIIQRKKLAGRSSYFCPKCQKI